MLGLPASDPRLPCASQQGLLQPPRGRRPRQRGTPEMAPESGDNEEASQILFTWASEEMLGKEVGEEVRAG